MKNVLNLTATQARLYFLESKNYCNFDLPHYFNFGPLLRELSKKLTSATISSYYAVNPSSGKSIDPNDIEDVNHKILSNKDGRLAWRPFELIHPALYVDLVHFITENSTWTEIQSRFKEFSKSGISCQSIPVVSNTKKSHKSNQILWWWESMEQESIKMALEYRYVFDADITDCYGSIYTHSISWSLHSKDKSRLDRSKNRLTGSKIDKKIQRMNYRQTNGIPQGNIVSDLIAEMVLGYADTILKEKIINIPKSDYKILRYRDDYKIFTNKQDVGLLILKSLSETLAELGLKLNTSKTRENVDPILGSIKEDKIDEMFVPLKRANYAKWLMQIYATLYKHPNSGKCARQLSQFHERLLKRHKNGRELKKYEKPETMLSMITNIAILNPKYYHWTVAIASILLDYCAPSARKGLVNKIIKKFNDIPNTGILDIWLQRVVYPTQPNKKFKEYMTKVVTLGSYPGNQDIWNSSWLNITFKKIVDDTPIVDRLELAKVKPVISRSEVDFFNTPMQS